MERTGLGRYGLELTAALAEVRPDWELFLYSNRPEILPPGLRHRACTTRVPTASAPGRIAWLHGAARLETRSSRPDVWFSPTFVLPAWWRGPSVVTVHDLTFLMLPGRYRGRANARYATVATRVSVRRADRVLVGATQWRDALVERLGADPAKIAVIPYGVAAEFFAASEAAASRDAGDAPPYLLFVGTWEARKGLETIEAALARLNRDGPRVRLVLAGRPGWGTEALVGRLRADPAVTVVHDPPDAEVARLYRGALALVYPSRMEGFGLPVAEAMAAGCPVVASELPVIREFARDAPLYAAVGDDAAVAAHVEVLLGDPALRDERAAAGISVAAGLRWRQVADRTAAVLEAAGRREPLTGPAVA